MVFVPEFYKLYESKTRGKKFDIYLPNGKGGVKRVSFGAKNYPDYTIHYRRDPEYARERRRLYRLRHSKDYINDPYKPSFWSWRVLWGDYPTIGENLEHAVFKARNII